MKKRIDYKLYHIEKKNPLKQGLKLKLRDEIAKIIELKRRIH